MLLIAAVGVMADKRPIAAAARAPNVRCGRIAGDIAGGVAFAASSSLVERGLVGVLGFVNLVNFTDGLDWMTVVEVVPITAALGHARVARHFTLAAHNHQLSVVRRDYWLRVLQPSGCKTFSRRRRESSNRPAVGLATSCACERWLVCRRGTASRVDSFARRLIMGEQFQCLGSSLLTGVIA